MSEEEDFTHREALYGDEDKVKQGLMKLGDYNAKHFPIRSAAVEVDKAIGATKAYNATKRFVNKMKKSFMNRMSGVSKSNDDSPTTGMNKSQSKENENVH
ncbi:MAG: hypothetical protein AABY27_01530 [Pseudomonadota bacterium]